MKHIKELTQKEIIKSHEKMKNSLDKQNKINKKRNSRKTHQKSQRNSKKTFESHYTILKITRNFLNTNNIHKKYDTDIKKRKSKKSLKNHIRTEKQNTDKKEYQ